MKKSRVINQHQLLVERVTPGFVSKYLEREHLARYRWASRWVKGRSVLDIACGTGYGSAMLLKAGARQVVGVDRSHVAIAFAAETYPGPSYVLGDALTLPFKGASFDIIVSFETIEHLADPFRFLQEIRRSIRGQGMLFLSTPNKSLSDGSNPYHRNEMDLSELLDIVDQTGFRIVQVRGQHWTLRQRKGLWRVKGLGRLAYEIGRRSWIWMAPSLLRLEPYNWCLLARPKTAN